MTRNCTCSDPQGVREDDGTISCGGCGGTVDYREAPDELVTCSRCGRSAAFRYDDYEQGWVSVCCTWPAARLDPVED
jgi:hypothetical protein